VRRNDLHFLRRLRQGIQPVRDRLLLSGIRLMTGIAISYICFAVETEVAEKEESRRR
jgi:hypothetical protein